MKRIVAIALLVAGCSSAPTASLVAPATSNPTQAASASAEPIITPTTEPSTTTGRFVAGDKISVTQNDQPWAEITITDVKQRSQYGSGYSVSKAAAGNIYLQARITYVALADGVDYNPYDWQLFVDGTAVNNTTFVLDAPKPELNSGTLPKGRKASGFVVYEVPLKGEVLLSYQGLAFTNNAPVFEVVLRSK